MGFLKHVALDAARSLTALSDPYWLAHQAAGKMGMQSVFVSSSTISSHET